MECILETPVACVQDCALEATYTAVILLRPTAVTPEKPVVDRLGEVRWITRKYSMTGFAETHARLALVSERLEAEQAVLDAAQKRSVASSLRSQVIRRCVSCPTSLVPNALTVRKYEM